MDWGAPNHAEAFKLFKQQCELYFTIRDVKKEKQSYHIIYFTGQEGIKRSNAWQLSEDDRKDPEKIWTNFEAEIVEPTLNFRISRLSLRKYKQDQAETIDEFISRCKNVAFQCKFRDDKEFEERLIEQIIDGTPYSELQKELLAKDGMLDLAGAIKLARNHEASILHMRQLQEAQGATAIHDIKYETKRKAKGNCMRCGGDHPKQGRCPAIDSECRYCGKYGHWANVCMAKQNRGQSEGRGNRDQNIPQCRDNTRRRRSANHSRNNSYNPQHNSRDEAPRPRRDKIHSFQQEDTYDLREGIYEQHECPSDEGPSDSYTFCSIQISTMEENRRDEAFAKLDIDLDKHIKADLVVKIDTGAQANTLPMRIYRRMFPEKLDAAGYPKPGTTMKSPAVLTAYNGTRINQHGSLILPCRYKNSKWHDAHFYVVDSDGPAIIGLPDLQRFQLVTLHCAIKQEMKIPVTVVNTTQQLVQAYPNSFDKIGDFKTPYHITLDPDIQPRIHAPRIVPIHVKQDIERQLHDMLKTNIIRRVDEPTDWVSSITWSLKNNNTWRICLDARDVNKAVKRPHHKTPTLEEIQHKLTGAKVFSKLDAKNGYWSVHLDQESQLLTTFNSPLGRLCFRRMPFGLKMSQDVFQHRMDLILEKVGPGVIGIADDIVVFGKDEVEHDIHLHKLMQVAEQEGLVFNSSKCLVKTESIPFYGMMYDKEGVHPDPAKINDIKRLEPPSNKEDLQHFLGIATYMGPFVPHLSTQTAPLRELLKKDSEFTWTPAQQQAYDRVKNAICQETTLAYFNPALPTTIQVDASSTGIGAVLTQKGKPIAFASKTLTATEQRYANIEREMLAVVFGCSRFHNYIFGKPFTVESDHKPLEMITLKNINAAPPRLQRMLTRIQSYNCTIKYRPGKEMMLPDALSRLRSQNIKEIPLDIKIAHVQFTDSKVENIREATSADPVLSELKEVTMTGWPDEFKKLPKPLRLYWPFRDQLSVENGVLLNGRRIMIPASLQEDILQQLHNAHQGIRKTQLLARNHVYWNNIDQDIESLVKLCPICQEYARSQTAQPLIQHDVPSGPWQVIGSDIFTFAGHEYVIVADYYTKFPIIRKLTTYATSQSVINTLKEIFSEHGIPEKLITDNGPQYASYQFAQFTNQWNIQHITSSPRYPRSNGFIERSIQTVKHTMAKARRSHQDYHMALLTLRSTPIDSELPSPAELLYSRKIKGLLPVKQPFRPNSDQVREGLVKRQQVQKMYHDRTAQELRPLIRGQDVNIQDYQSGRWSPAMVIEKCPEPRSYIVQTPEGAKYRRNRVHLRDVDQGSPHKAVRFADHTNRAFSANPDHQMSLNLPDQQMSQNHPNHQMSPRQEPHRASSVTPTGKTEPENSKPIYMQQPARPHPEGRTSRGRPVKAPQRLIEQ